MTELNNGAVAYPRSEDEEALLESETQRCARLAVAHYATDVGDARTLMAMLGLIDGPPPPAPSKRPAMAPVPNPGWCLACGIRTERRPTAGAAPYGGRGLCGKHYQEQLRAERKARQR